MNFGNALRDDGFHFGHREAGRVAFEWGKQWGRVITYPARTYFLPVREERQWHTKEIPKTTFMHLEQSEKRANWRNRQNKTLDAHKKLIWVKFNVGRFMLAYHEAIYFWRTPHSGQDLHGNTEISDGRQEGGTQMIKQTLFPAWCLR